MMETAFHLGPAGSDAERRAARQLEERLRELGREAETEPISIHPNFGVTHALHALIAVVGSVLSVDVPIAGAALVLLAAVSTFGDLSGTFHLLRRLTGRRASQNVTSREDGGKPGIVVLTAHYDAARDAAVLERPIAFTLFFWSLLAVLVCCVVRLAGLEGMPLTIVQFVPTVALIACVPPFVDIALSPASGSANRGVETVLRLAESKLKHFDVWVVFPGAKEALMLGMRAWLKGHKGELDPATAVFVNVEGERWAAKQGLVVGMRFHPDLVRLCEGRGASSRGFSDALMARASGFPAITLGSDYEDCAEFLQRLDAEIGPELS